MATDDAAGKARRSCVFCGGPGKLTDEHVLPFWLDSGETSHRAHYFRVRGGPDYEPWQHARPGKPRDLQARAVCAACNNGWMNDMDHTMSVLGPQLVKGKPVSLTKSKQAVLAAWSVKLALMLHLVYPRDSRFVIPAPDYPQFHADRRPSDTTMMWAGFMEPPGNEGGALLSFAEHRHDVARYGADLLSALGVNPSLASDGYSVKFRLGYLVVGLLRVGCPDVLPYAVLASPQSWVQIWPPRGASRGPPWPTQSRIGLTPMEAGFRPNGSLKRER